MNVQSRLLGLLGFIFLSTLFLPPCAAELHKNTTAPVLLHDTALTSAGSAQKETLSAGESQSSNMESLKQAGRWAQVQENIERQAYHVVHSAQTAAPDATSAYQATNRRQNLKLTFSPAEVNIQPANASDDSWQTHISLESVGSGTQSVEIPDAASTRAEGPRIEFQRGSVQEWYQNSPEGIEQGFTLLEKPKGAGPLMLGLSTRGQARPVLSAAGDAVDFITPAGRKVLTYAKLHVFDGNGRVLPSRFEVRDRHIHLIIADGGAVYPITVDPLFTAPEWSWANAATAVSTAGDINGDGFSDVIVGDFNYDLGRGRAFVFYGSADGLGTTPDWQVVSAVENAWFGYAVATAGDVNGDGYSDVIIGAPNYSNGSSWEGAVYVYYGSAGGLSPEPDWSAESNEQGAYFGRAVGTAGDVNGDGYSDIIIGAPGSEYHSRQTGDVYVFHGSASGLGSNGTPANADWTARGDQVNAAFGGSVSTAGDVNGDGYSDILVGAYRYDSAESNEGKVFAYYGSGSGLGASGTTVNADWSRDGYNVVDMYFGAAVATAGDVNGDGYSDVIIGATGYSSSKGLAMVFLGSGSGLSASFNWYYDGVTNLDQVGSAVGTAGDVNGDGFADVVVGSGQGNAIYLLKGSATGLPPTGQIPTRASWSQSKATSFGKSAATAGDVDGDGFSDIIAGGAAAYVYAGSFPGIAATPSQTLTGASSSWLGTALNAAGDVNGDGYADMVVGNWRHDGTYIGEGITYVYYGSATGVNLASPWTVTGGEQSAKLGYAVHSAGDINGDGYDDILIGAPGYGDYGAAMVYYGSASGMTTPPAIVLGDANQGEVCFGEVAAPAGDVNGDGYDDILVSAPIYDFAGGREGAVFLYLGSSSGLVTTPAWDVFGQEGSYRYGSTIGRAGDVNGDGFADFYVTGKLNGVQGIFVYYGASGGPSETASWTAADTIYAASTAGDVNSDGFADIVVSDSTYSEFRGRIVVFHGSPSGLDLNGARPVGSFANADWSMAASTPNGYFGGAVSAAGDANRDGFSDIIVGAPFSYSTTSSGKAYIYYGSESGITSADPWTYEYSQADNNADFGSCVASAGDINGDAFGDIVISAPEYSSATPSTYQGRIFFFNGNDGGGSSMPLPEQLETDYSSPIDKMGMSDSETAFVFSATGRPPFGRGKVKVEWEAKPADQPFDGTNTFTSGTWQDSGVAGYTFTQQVSGLIGHTPYKWRIRFRYRAGNPMGLAAGSWQVPFAEGHYYLQTNNTPPIGGYTADNVIPTDQEQIVQSTQENQSGVMTVHFRIRDAGINDCTLHTFQYSVDGGISWKTPPGGDASGSLSGGWPDNGGTLYSSATDWSGAVHAFTFSTRHADVQADFTGVDQSDVCIRFSVNDGLDTSVLPVTSNAFRVDGEPPGSGTITIMDSDGTTSDATPLLTLSSTGADYMRLALSEGGLASAAWLPYAADHSAFNIGADGNGFKTVWVEYRDQYWNIQSSHAWDTTFYDTSPIVAGAAVTYDTTPTWTWSSSGDGNGLFRYKLDDSDLTNGATQTSGTSVTPSQVLSEGEHTLYVQEWNTAGYWGLTGSFSIEVDSGRPCSQAASPAAVDDLSQTFSVTYSYDDIYAGETCGGAASGSGLSSVDLWVKAPGEDSYTLVDTDTEGAINGLFSYTATDQGAYDFYTLATDRAGNIELSTGADTRTIYASQFSGYAILSVGAISGEEGLDAHTLTANNVYRHLIHRNFALVDDPVDKWLDPLDYIKYYNPYATLQTGEDDYSEGGAVSYWTAMQKAVTQWALNKMTLLPGPLYIILIDHGTPDKFYLSHPMDFTSSELNGWLTTLEDGLTAQGISEDIIVILGTCYSGSFIDELSKPGRIIVASAAADEPSYRGPMEPGGIRDGEFFISSLFNELGRGNSLQASFLNAVDRIEIHTDSGTTNCAAPYFDVAMQHPYLDDDGTLPGSHELTPGGDGNTSKNIFLGYATDAPQPVSVTAVVGYPETLVSEENHSALLWASVSDPVDTERVWVEIREPGTILEGGVEQQLVELDEITLTVSGDRYEATYDGFWYEGRYTLFFYAKDKSGLISPFKKSYAYKEISSNTAPNAFSLISPADTSTVSISSVLDWEDSLDTADGHDVSYIVTVSTNSNLTDSAYWVYHRQGLIHSTVSISAEDGIQNLTTYYWQVIAMDAYGAATASPVWSFTTDSTTNPLAGWIKGYVYNTTTGDLITSATLSLSGHLLNSSLDGYYLGILTAGDYDTTVSAPGFAAVGPITLTIPEGGILTRNFGLTQSGDLQMLAVIVSPASNVIVVEGESVNFQASVTGGNAPITCRWDFDGGAAASDQEDPGNIIFPTAGIYTVTFTATDADDEMSGDSVKITVNIPEDSEKTKPGGGGGGGGCFIGITD